MNAEQIGQEQERVKALLEDVTRNNYHAEINLAIAAPELARAYLAVLDELAQAREREAAFAIKEPAEWAVTAFLSRGYYDHDLGKSVYTYTPMDERIEAELLEAQVILRGIVYPVGDVPTEPWTPDSAREGLRKYGEEP